MRILALETSAKTVSAAVLEDDRVLASGYLDTGLTHSRTLMPLIRDLLRNAELELSGMEAIAVAAGPGSFTGIRIGIAAAKGLAFAEGLPAVGVSTLEAMAWNLSGWEGLAVCTMDARRGQVYNAVFELTDGAPRRLTEDRAIALTDLAEEWRADPRRKWILGDGSSLCRQVCESQGLDWRLAPSALRYQNGVGVALAASVILERGGGVDAQTLAPVYLRPPYALTLTEQKNHAKEQVR